MKRPIPAAVASLSVPGIAVMMSSRTRATVRMVKTTPEMKTMPRAMGHGTPIFPQTTKLKYALSPMPGASAIG